MMEQMLIMEEEMENTSLTFLPNLKQSSSASSEFSSILSILWKMWDYLNLSELPNEL